MLVESVLCSWKFPSQDSWCVPLPLFLRLVAWNVSMVAGALAVVLVKMYNQGHAWGFLGIVDATGIAGTLTSY